MVCMAGLSYLWIHGLSSRHRVNVLFLRAALPILLFSEPLPALRCYILLCQPAAVYAPCPVITAS
jgi:hypothetical protein